ncbi:helix-turn-helix domain-containing protein [Clostridium botulinum]|uniref:helix-turn-helix domain-containing protein n=1 Tax=Clostridium botulinum TaxID=1491 RepID=UPI0007DE81A9|nr:helix-turn-helix transcriptional regulator [Clostridium botulinum]KEI92177.1 Cro/Cl family transcriptional regulator [Clostridium botulinum B2 275]NFC89037.1 XRE family transcriptional regulator [Clostridium botulinum]NFD55371.1 XRE family transcriptional regulator [Clostridium botulinum]
MIKVNIDKMLKKKNKSAYWLSKEGKMAYNNLSKLIKNETNSIKFENLETICDLLECEISDVLEIVKED